MRALAALYTGHLPATELARLGALRGPADDLDRLDAIFGGGLPTMTEMF